MKELKSKKLIVGSKKYFDYLAEEKISVALQIEGDLNEGATQRFHMKADNIIRCRQEIAALTRAGVNVGLANMYLDRIESNSEAFFDSIDWNESNPPTRHRNRPGLPNIRITGLDEGLDELRETLQPLARYLGNDAINNTLTNIANAANAAIDASANVAGGRLMGTFTQGQHIDNTFNRGRANANFMYNYELQKKIPQDFINEQGGYVGDFKMSNFTTGGNGCGWIAVYNAALVLDKFFYPADIILYFEKIGGFTLAGRLGTNPEAIQDFFRSQGFSTQMQYLPRNLDEAIKGSRVSILAYLHETGSHYVAVRYDMGQFEVFNDHVSSIKSVDEWLADRKVLILISVR